MIRTWGGGTVATSLAASASLCRPVWIEARLSSWVCPRRGMHGAATSTSRTSHGRRRLRSGLRPRLRHRSRGCLSLIARPRLRPIGLGCLREGRDQMARRDAPDRARLSPLYGKRPRLVDVPKVIAIAALAVILAAAAGAWTPSARPTSTARCPKVSPTAISSIRSGLHASVRRKLRARATRAVKARGDFSNAPRGFSHGLYFISANFRATGVASWAVSTSFLRSGAASSTPWARPREPYRTSAPTFRPASWRGGASARGRTGTLSLALA
jgi:hypothetical protein